MKKVNKDNLEIGCTYIDTLIEQQASTLIFVGKFYDEERDDYFLFFYPIKNNGYKPDNDGTIPFNDYHSFFMYEVE